MSTYHVYLRKGALVVVTAAGYTEGKRAERFYFHQNPEAKDRVSFFNARDVAGIHAFEVQEDLSIEAINNLWKQLKQNPVGKVAVSEKRQCS